AYLLGLAVIQSAIALVAMAVARSVAGPSRDLSPLRLVGAGIAGIGLAVLVQQVVPGRWSGPAPHALQKTREIGGQVIDVWRIAPLKLPGLAENFALAFWHDQHGGHAECMRGFQIARQILEHRRFRRVDAMAYEEALIDLRHRFRIEVRGGDVEHI